MPPFVRMLLAGIFIVGVVVMVVIMAFIPDQPRHSLPASRGDLAAVAEVMPDIKVTKLGEVHHCQIYRVEHRDEAYLLTYSETDWATCSLEAHPI